MLYKNIIIIDPVGIKAGMDQYSFNLAKGLSSSFAPIVFTNYSKSDEFIGVKSIFYNGSSLFIKGLNWFFAHLLVCIYSIFKCPRAVIFHSFSYEFKDFLVVALFKICRIPIVIILHDVSNFSKLDNGFYKKRILGYADFLIVHNNFSLLEAKKLGIHGLDDKLHVIRHGSFIDLPNKSITKDIARVKLGIDSDQKVILFFGQIKKVKGLDILINAFNLCQCECNLIIAGKTWKDSSILYNHLINTSPKTSSICFYNKYISNDERELFFKAADVIVLPYREIYQSGVLLMAMSYNLPVIASNLPANLEIIEDKVNGLLFEDGNYHNLSNVIDYFFDNEHDNISIKSNGYELMAKEFNWITIGDEYIKLLDK